MPCVPRIRQRDSFQLLVNFLDASVVYLSSLLPKWNGLFALKNGKSSECRICCHQKFDFKIFFEYVLLSVLILSWRLQTAHWLDCLWFIPRETFICRGVGGKGFLVAVFFFLLLLLFWSWDLMWPSLVSNLLCCQGWPWTPDISVSISQC